MVKKIKKVSNFKIQKAGPAQHERDNLINFFSSGKGEEAYKLAQDLTRSYPDFVLGWKIINIYLRQMGQFDAAYEAVMKCQGLASSDPEVFN